MTPNELEALNDALAIRLDVITQLEGAADALQRNLDAFATRFANHPVDALRWATQTFDDAAALQLHREAIPFLKGAVNPDYAGDRIECLRTEYTRDVMRQARLERWSSSSVLANLTEEAARVAKAKFLEDLERAERVATMRRKPTS